MKLVVRTPKVRLMGRVSTLSYPAEMRGILKHTMSLDRALVVQAGEMI